MLKRFPLLKSHIFFSTITCRSDLRRTSLITSSWTERKAWISFSLLVARPPYPWIVRNNPASGNLIVHGRCLDHESGKSLSRNINRTRAWRSLRATLNAGKVRGWFSYTECMYYNFENLVSSPFSRSISCRQSLNHMIRFGSLRHRVKADHAK